MPDPCFTDTNLTAANQQNSVFDEFMELILAQQLANYSYSCNFDKIVGRLLVFWSLILSTIVWNQGPIVSKSTKNLW